MSETKFTKGEWIVEDGKVVVCNGHKVAYVNSGDNIPYFENIKANAHLIAAAPEMYEALNMQSELLGFLDIQTHPEIELDAVKHELDKLLAKARGELC